MEFKIYKAITLSSVLYGVKRGFSHQGEKIY